jgi:hypothetical protein
MDATINGLMRALLDELAAEGVPAPLRESFTLAAVWLDLCRLAGETPPAEVLAVLDEGRVELAAD